MKSLKNIALSILLTVGAFSAVTYTACTKDACRDVYCQNGGVCSGGTCNCPTGYEGNRCEYYTVDYFKGTWYGKDICSSGSYTYTLTVTPSTYVINAIINNPGKFGTTVNIIGVVYDSYTLDFYSQPLGNNKYLDGTMTFNNAGNKMTFSYTVTDNSTGSKDYCTGSFTLQ